MAKIKLGPNLFDISGSVKDVVYAKYQRLRWAAKSKAGVYQNPQSRKQAKVREAAQKVSSIWRDDLTPSQRTKWNNWALYLAAMAVGCGGTRELIKHNGGIMSGYNAFFMCYLRLALCDITIPASFYDSPLGQTSPSGITDFTAAWGAPGTVNYALLFDGVNEFIDVGDVLGYEYNQPQSWEFWVNPTSPAGVQGFIAKEDLAATRLYGCLFVPPNLVFQISRLSATEVLQITRSFPFTGVWKHVVVTYDGSNNANGMRIYIDTVVGQVVTSNIPLTGTIKTTDPLTFGSINATPSIPMTGQLDCIRNYNRVLIQAEVNTLFNAGAGLYSANPFVDGSCIGAWMFCTGSGNTLFDIAGFGLHGTLVNMEAGDWVAGKVPCPITLPVIQLYWTDPIKVIANSRIRFWIRSRELGVHKQLIECVGLSNEDFRLSQVRMSQGAVHAITDFPGHYLIQADVVQPNGLLSPPSNTVEVTVP